MKRVFKSSSETSYSSGTIRLYKSAPGITATNGKMQAYHSILDKVQQLGEAYSIRDGRVYISHDDGDGVVVYWKPRAEGLFKNVPDKVYNNHYVLYCIWTDKDKYLEDNAIRGLYAKHKSFVMKPFNPLGKSKSLV